MALTLPDPQGFDAIDELQDLSLQPQQLGPRLAKLPVLVGEFLHGGNLLRRWRDVLGSALAAVAQHGAGVEFALGTVASGLAAAATQHVHGAGQKGFPPEECFPEGRELLLEFVESLAEGTEVVGHGAACGKERNAICILLYKLTYRNQGLVEKNPSGAKNREMGTRRQEEGAGTAIEDRWSPR
jgi:hypothetical protein